MAFILPSNSQIDAGCKANCWFSNCSSSDSGASCSCSWGFATCGFNNVIQLNTNNVDNMKGFLTEIKKYGSKELEVSLKTIITYSEEYLKNPKNSKKYSEKIMQEQLVFVENVRKLNSSKQAALNKWVFEHENDKETMKEKTTSLKINRN
jgi:hypothetical protein